LEYASSAVLDPARDDLRGGRRAGPPPKRRGGRSGGYGRKRKDPLWAKLLVIFGAVLMLGSGSLIVGQKLIFAAATSSFNQTSLLDPAAQAQQHVTINGAKNILLVGVDSRPGQNPTDLVRADSIMILHIAATHDRAYLVSIPRDTYADIPAYNNGKSKYNGGKDKINAAFAYGGQGLDFMAGRQNGFRLLQQTIKKDYNIDFQAGAIVDFQGFQDVVKVLGGVNMCVDEEVKSIHIGTNNKTGKFAVPATIDDASRPHPVPGVTPKTYKPGCYHLAPYEALDYVRQRDWLANGDGDYGRTRHQQQFIKAVFKGILSGNVLGDPGKLKNVLGVVGKAMTVDNGGINLEDWIFAMRNVTANNVFTIKTNGGAFNSKNIGGIDYEVLNDTSLQLLSSVRADNVDGFIQQHTDWVSAQS
jgi:polyisoprenyl-teichoic acid--peptidoglycan teichoic acid transferase